MKTKVLYIPAVQKNLQLQISKSEFKKLPKKLILVYSIQYKDLAKKIKEQLQLNNIKVKKFQQILGCSKIKNKNNLPILLISTGTFHAQHLYLQTPALYYLENNKILKVSKKEINNLKIQKKSSLMKFLAAEKVGILVSIKPGQYNLKLAMKIEKKIKKQFPEKQVYIFLADNIDASQFENFNIDSWINTACPGLEFDNPYMMNGLDLMTTNF